jgi:DNA-binding transcriptional ArsR family regulator
VETTEDTSGESATCRPRGRADRYCTVWLDTWYLTMRNNTVTYQRVNRVAHALADPIRREILLMLHGAVLSAGDIAGAFDVSRPAISRHLRVLREAELVYDEASGRERLYQLDVSPLNELLAFVNRLRAPTGRWQRRFDALETEVHRVKRRRRQSEAQEQEIHDRQRSPRSKRA